MTEACLRKECSLSEGAKEGALTRTVGPCGFIVKASSISRFSFVLKLPTTLDPYLRPVPRATHLFLDFFKYIFITYFESLLNLTTNEDNNLPESVVSSSDWLFIRECS